MDKIKIGEKIKAAVLQLPTEDGKRMTVEKFNAWLETNKHGLKFDKSLFSRIMKGSEGVADRHYEDLCRVLGVEYKNVAQPLKIGFSQGFWAAPLLVHNHVQTSMNRDLFSQVRFSAYSQKNTPYFSNPGKELPNFDKGKNSTSEPSNPDNEFYFSGEIIGLLRKRPTGEYPIDIGFCGSTVFEDDDTFIRVARLADARKARHAGVLIAPKGAFQATDELSKEQVMLRYLLGKETEGKPDCHILYQLGSTSEKECQLLFQKTRHKRETIQILNVNRYKEEFKKRLLEKPDDVWVQIALLLTTNAAESVVKELPQSENFDMMAFRTSDLIDKAIMDEAERAKLGDKGFYYEMVILRDRVQEIVRHPGFMMLFDYLKNAVTALNQTKAQEGDSHDAFNRVAAFWGLPPDEVNKRLKQTEFSLLIYPEFAKQLLEIAQK